MNPRILFNPKDHPNLNSGYGIIARYLLPYLGDRYGRENVIIYAPIFQRDHVGEWDGMKVISGNTFDFGENLILQHYKNYECNLLLQVGDTWPLGILPDLAYSDQILWVQWAPVDWLGMPKNIVNRIRAAHKLVPFSKYGENSLKRGGLPNVGPTIWLGLNLDIWKPLPRKDFPVLMNSLGYSYDSFNVLMVAANQERKRIRQELEALGIFRKLSPNVDLRIYLHSPLVGERDLRADLDELELNDITTFPDPYIMTQGGFPEEHMAKVFNCADIVLNVAMEGFGLCQTQAQACGVPVVVLSEGAGPELTVFGWEIPATGVETSAAQMAQPMPDPISIARCLEEAWKLKQERGELRSQAAVDFIRGNFGWDKIAQQWFRVIDECMIDYQRYCLQVPFPSEDLHRRANNLLEVT